MTKTRRNLLKSLATTGIAISATSIASGRPNADVRLRAQNSLVSRYPHPRVLSNQGKQYLTVTLPRVAIEQSPRLDVNGNQFEPVDEVDDIGIEYISTSNNPSYIPGLSDPTRDHHSNQNPADESSFIFELPSESEYQKSRVQANSDSIKIPPNIADKLSQPPEINVNNISVDAGEPHRIHIDVENKGGRTGVFRATYGPQYNGNFFLLEEPLTAGESKTVERKIGTEIAQDKILVKAQNSKTKEVNL